MHEPEISSDNRLLLGSTVFHYGNYIPHSVKSLFELIKKIASLPEALLLRERKKEDTIGKFWVAVLPTNPQASIFDAVCKNDLTEWFYILYKITNFVSIFQIKTEYHMHCYSSSY